MLLLCFIVMHFPSVVSGNNVNDVQEEKIKSKILLLLIFAIIFYNCIDKQYFVLYNNFTNLY